MLELRTPKQSQDPELRERRCNIKRSQVSTVPPRPPGSSLKRVQKTGSTVSGVGGKVKGWLLVDILLDANQKACLTEQPLPMWGA